MTGRDGSLYLPYLRLLGAPNVGNVVENIKNCPIILRNNMKINIGFKSTIVTDSGVQGK